MIHDVVKHYSQLLYEKGLIQEEDRDIHEYGLTALAKHLLGVKWDMAGPKYFKYKS